MSAVLPLTNRPAVAHTPAQEQHRRLVQQLRSTFGPIICDAFDDHAVVEIMLNDNGQVLIERHGRGTEIAGALSPQQGQNAISLVAGWIGATGNADNPIVEGALPPEFGGARFEGVLPPCSPGPMFAIRLKARSIFTLDQYVERGIMSSAQSEILKEAVADHKNILVSGGTGSGKSTLLNALLAEISSGAGLDDRIIVIEDTPELQCSAPNYASLLTKNGVDMTRLLKATLRLRPNRIIVGEVRDGAALALLKAWNTGHPGGLATLHANNPEAALLRLDQLCQEAGVPPQTALITEAVDVVVQISHTSQEPGRRVTDILIVKKERLCD